MQLHKNLSMQQVSAVLAFNALFGDFALLIFKYLA